MPYDPEKFKKSIDQDLSASGVPPGKTENQPTLRDQIEAEKAKELASRVSNQNDPESQGFGRDIRNAGAGLKSGLKRQDTPPGAGLAERAGNAVGRYGPVVAATALAPGLGAAAGLGEGVLAGAASTGVTAGLGEIGGLSLSKIFGGNAPDTAGGYASAGLKTGLGLALTDLGIGAAGKAIAKAPEIAGAFMRVPSEAIKRIISRMKEGVDIIPKGGPGAQLNVEMRATKNLANLQDAVLGHRKQLGDAVDAALENLHTKTMGAKVFDVKPLAQDIRQFMRDEMQAADPTVKKLLGQENEKLLSVVKSMERNPMKTAKAMVQIRRELDGMGGYSAAGVPKIESDAGQRIYKRLADNFREVIDGSGRILKDDKLTKANQNFHGFAGTYDEIKPLLGTRDQGLDALKTRLKTLENKFNDGGIGPELMEKLGSDVPGLKKYTTQLNDDLAARGLIRNYQGLDHSVTRDLIKTIVDPTHIGKLIGLSQSKPAKYAGKAISPGLKTIAAYLSQPDQSPPAPTVP